MMTINEEFFKIISDNYQELKHICEEVSKRNHDVFNEDIFNDTIIKINDIIDKKGRLDDMTEKGIMNYFVRSYANNLRCIRRNSYIAKRDLNVTDDEMIRQYDKNGRPLKDKLIHDLYEDFSILYIMKSVEENFNSEEFYLYRLKTLCQMTYKQIFDKTQIKKSREKIVNINRWIKQNITRDDIKKQFNQVYGNLII